VTRLTALELAGFAAIIGVFIALFALLDVQEQSWGSFGLLAAGLAALVGYRYLLARRRSDG
jgi:hypothetical protein